MSFNKYSVTINNTGGTPDGTLQFSTDGSSFSDVGVVSNTSALLLDEDDILRFIPEANFFTTGSGAVSTAGSFTFRAWDQRTTTSGTSTLTAGTKVDTSTNGGTSDGRFMAKVCDQIIELGLTNRSIHKINESVKEDALEVLKNIYKNILSKVFSS